MQTIQFDKNSLRMIQMLDETWTDWDGGCVHETYLRNQENAVANTSDCYQQIERWTVLNLDK